MASPQIFEDLSSGFSILLQKKSEHTFLCYPLFQDYLNLLTLVALKISAQPLFYAKNYSQASKNLAVGVKYKYANPYIITQELYFE